MPDYGAVKMQLRDAAAKVSELVHIGFSQNGLINNIHGTLRPPLNVTLCGRMPFPD